MQATFPREDLRPWFRTLRDLPEAVGWDEFFERDRPVEIDVGCGRGLFLVNASTANPERNYLGIEIDYKEGRRTAARLKRRASGNARVLGGDVHEAFAKCLPAGSVDVVYVYFPDPWWKRKHRKRRVFTDEFVGEILRVLKPDGLVSSASDVEEYFAIIRGLMDHHAAFEALPGPPERRPDGQESAQTSFERKARQRGKTIHQGRWRRIG